jgi:hypothetical protein
VHAGLHATRDGDAGSIAADFWRLVAHISAEEETVFPQLESTGARWLIERREANVKRQEDLTRSITEF